MFTWRPHSPYLPTPPAILSDSGFGSGAHLFFSIFLRNDCLKAFSSPKHIRLFYTHDITQLSVVVCARSLARIPIRFVYFWLSIIYKLQDKCYRRCHLHSSSPQAAKSETAPPILQNCRNIPRTSASLSQHNQMTMGHGTHTHARTHTKGRRNKRKQSLAIKIRKHIFCFYVSCVCVCFSLCAKLSYWLFYLIYRHRMSQDMPTHHQ